MKINSQIAYLILILSSFTQLNAQTWGDYTFYSLKNSSTATLIDMQSNVYHTWGFESNKRTGYSAYLLPGGTVLRSYSLNGKQLTGGGMTGGVQLVDWNGIVLWDFTYSSSTYCIHHDICPLPNGNVLMISYDVRTAAEATQAGAKSSMVIWSDKIIEVKKTGPTTGEIVWEWKLWDHLCQNLFPEKNNYVSSISEHPELININFRLQKDIMHMNGLDYNEDLDQIAFSSHFLNEVYIIDHSTTKEEAAGHTGGKSGKGGDILYRWGNPAAYGMAGKANFNVVHDAHWVPEGCPRANSLSGFNNQGGTGGKSAVDVFMPPYNGYNYSLNSGSAYLPSVYDFRYTWSGNATTNEGNAQQLPNGNTLMNVAMTGYIVEYDKSGKNVWTKTLSGSSSHAYRYTKCYVYGTRGKAPTIYKDGNLLRSEPGISYQWFLNGEPIEGAVNQEFTVTKNGYYRVQNFDSNGCESLLSAKLKIDSFTDVQELQNSDIIIYPTIGNGEFRISSDNLNGDYQVMISNSNGYQIQSFNSLNYFDLSGFENGVYFIRIINSDKNYFSKIVLIK